MWTRPFAIVALTVACSTAMASPAGGRLSTTDRRRAVERIALTIESNYYDAEQGRRIGDRLRTQLSAGAYDAAATTAALSRRLTDDLRKLDGHLTVAWSSDGAMEDEHHTEDWDAVGRMQNYWLREASVLPGNVGYLRINYLDAPERAGATVAAAMTFLQHTDALVIDLSENHGGELEMVQLLTSYFVGPTPKLLNTLYWRPDDRTQQYWTLPAVPAPRYVDKPVFIATTAGTGSGGEIFADRMRAVAGATLVGQTTYGAGNPGRFFYAGRGFNVFVPYGGPVDGSGVDLVGVKPDVETAAGQQVRQAKLRAWTALRATADDRRQKALLQSMIDRTRAEQSPERRTDAQLRTSTGDFGDRRIVLRAGELVYERGRRAPERLIVGPNDSYFPEGLANVRIDLVRDGAGRVQRMLMTWDGVHRESFERVD